MFSLQQINLRILMITRQIYINSRKNNLEHVYKLQKYLVNSNEAKYFFINVVLCKVKEYYSNCLDIKLLLNNMNKKDLLKSLFMKYFNNHKLSRIIIEQVRQSMVYRILEPSQKAKLVNSIANRPISSKNLMDYLQHETYKHLLPSIAIKKISCYLHVKKLIYYWTYSGTYPNLEHLSNTKYKCYKQKFLFKSQQLYFQVFVSLYNLLNRVILSDIKWYMFNCNRKYHYTARILVDGKKYRLRYSKRMNFLLARFQFYTYDILYRKKLKKRSIINFFHIGYQRIMKIKTLLNNYYIHIDEYIPISLVESCNKLLNQYIHILIKKQITFNLDLSYYISHIKLLNKYVNTFIYFKQLQNSYVISTFSIN
uniref:Reverse transcriptase N-terminal domain-containing protein n=1 Tax=Polysiphonia sp. TaxID=1967842 RepID=A0A1Z1MT93_9FLOR|nr:hypothetical protein [Polysiphonia sp.]